MRLLGDGLLDLATLVSADPLRLQLLLYYLEVVVDVLGVVQLLCFKVTFEERYLQSVTELYLLVFQHGALVQRTAEVGVAVDSAVVLASVRLVPLDTDPQLIAPLGLALMLELSKVSHCSAAVVEQHFASYELLPVLQVESFEPFGLGLEVILLQLALGGAGACGGLGREGLGFGVGFGLGVHVGRSGVVWGWFHY